MQIKYKSTQGKFPIYELQTANGRWIGTEHSIDKAKIRAKKYIENHPSTKKVDILKFVGCMEKSK